MRTTSLAVLLVAACGNGGDSKRDAAVPRDTGGPTADAPPLATCTPMNGNTISFRKIGSNVSGAALLVTSPPNDGRLFVLERGGRIRIFDNETQRSEAFLDISNLPGFAGSGEQGLLGLAFHPNYASNRQFYVFYTTDSANVVARYYVSETNLHKADPASEVILSIPDFAGNHNGGMIEFGPDGYLYIGTGDGGGADDPCRNAQQLTRTGNCVDRGGLREPLLGKILRIDVNTTSGTKKYGIPADNPYANGTNGEPEIFMRGLRNPWRWSFDRMTGDMYIGDVGQNAWEEVTVLTPDEQSDANLGWSIFEGDAQFYGPNNTTGTKKPQFVRNQTDNWLSVIGGQVYRGTCFPDLFGNYFFTDYNARDFMRGTFSGGALTASDVATAPASPTSLHADARGELYLTTIAGEVYQIEAGP